jgi:hypothetical protein
MIIGPIAAANFDAVIGIIAVVVWLIMQGLSKRGKANTPPPPPPSSGNGDQAPQDDLRRFFEELEKGLSRQAPAPTPPEIPPPVAHNHPARQQGLTRADVHGKAAATKRQLTVAKPPPVATPLPIHVSPVTLSPLAAEFTWNHDFPETSANITPLRTSDQADQTGKQRPPSPY